MNIRIYNARILTMERNKPIFMGELHAKGNRISYVGAELEKEDTRVQETTWDRQIDAKKNLIMPGFKNAHTHSAMTFLRSYADDLPLGEWLNQKVFPMEARLEKDDIYHLTKLAILEYLSSGTTGILDMYLNPDEVARAAIDCGFRIVICGALNDFTHSIEALEGWQQKYQDEEALVRFQLGFHAEYTTSREKMEQIAALSNRFHTPVYMHSTESKSEVEACKERYGMTPTKLFEELGLLEHGGAHFHCIHMSDEDFAILKRKQIYAVTNPSSNLKLASGIPDIQKMLDMGIPVAIGTDGPASNNCLDMFREMFLVTALAKIKTENAAAVDANEVLHMATVNGAHAMGLTQADVLAEGKFADLIMIDLKQPNMQPLHNISKNIVYSGSKINVKMTMVDGKILYEDGEYHVGTSAEEIYAKANEIARRICNERI